MPNEIVSFGFEDFWSVAHEAFPRFWEAYPRLLESINSVVVIRAYPKVDQLQMTSINLGMVAATCLSEITTLVGNGLGVGAMKIARSMLETVVNAEFLRRFPEHLDDYYDWWLVETLQTDELRPQRKRSTCFPNIQRNSSSRSTRDTKRSRGIRGRPTGQA